MGCRIQFVVCLGGENSQMGVFWWVLCIMAMNGIH